MATKWLKSLVLSGTLVTVGLIASNTTAHAAIPDGVKVQINNHLVNFSDAMPYLNQGSIMVPLRAVAENLGYKLEFEMIQNGTQVRVKLIGDGHVFEFESGKQEAKVDNRSITLDEAPVIKNDRVYVHIRSIGEHFGHIVQWDMNNNIGILGADGKYHAPAWYKPAKRTTPSKDVTLSAKKANESAGKQHTEKSADKKVEPATSKEIASTDKKSIVSKATGQVGVPYLWGGSSPSGFDCSGLVTYIFKQQGINLPRTSSGMYGVGTSVSNPEQGDLVFFANGGKVFHVGVYVGGNRFISATDDGVKIDSLGNSYWNKYYIGAKKVM
ncbi:NlpC/P60 family protein [Paenibacillus larvae]|uniref:NlpC/P60 family protein n=2 Tax=Paenibacillus larvae TaxID=1464 RepID=A0AAP5N350_9BACL|nr:NlpC/P60 family protein [Paenibacillus larvae]MCY9564696.1 NlpC/P60 family protein [Paenibacillus larvae]MCY9568916.1 NlpC/P60 family protein [Paenibacillus larvae]MDT2232579.1 NlpC/P60 family protein [Paenibacillus larvae]MDT2252164.1 NlpC/P60 family protein [Paenibacillus larvae]MDT2267780.1 NlpC/P60 family protein [Paenibacillus larvae]